MGRYIARQPNGLLCRFSTVVDCVTVYNMTEEDYIELCAEEAREEARYNLSRNGFIEPYSRIISDTLFNNTTEEQFKELRKKMGEEGLI